LGLEANNRIDSPTLRPRGLSFARTRTAVALFPQLLVLLTDFARFDRIPKDVNDPSDPARKEDQQKPGQLEFGFGNGRL
jgi:hypothetical protein